MSKRSSRARATGQRWARDDHAERRARSRSQRFAIPSMTVGERAAERVNDVTLRGYRETRPGVMHSGYSASDVYRARVSHVAPDQRNVSDRELYGSHVDQYRALRDAAKIERRQEAEAEARAAKAARAEAEAARRRREAEANGSGWA